MGWEDGRATKREVKEMQKDRRVWGEREREKGRGSC